ncbi:MAG: hypothetical protein R3B84_17335 [Zavarzinella sp.]
MIVPEYWAEARIQIKHQGRSITVRRFGWSDESQEAAQAHAQARAEEALEIIKAGADATRREPKVPYNGAEGVPIREEVIARYGDMVITRNSYGAWCINTPDVLFVDVDDDQIGDDAGCWIFLALIVLSIYLGVRNESWKIGLLCVFASFPLTGVLSNIVSRMKQFFQGNLETRYFKRLEQFVANRPDWNIRVYRTPNGYRLLVTHRTFQTTDPEVLECFMLLSADPTYEAMCINQQCFRARVTPKPWRVGITQHIYPRRGVWPVAPEYAEARQQWIAEYNLACQDFASCEYLMEIGSGKIDRKVDVVIQFHDKLSKATSGLPIA